MAEPVIQEAPGTSLDAPYQRPPEPWETGQPPSPQAQKRAQDLNELESQIYQNETSSGANVHTSSAGARGPMQIMPATFDKYAAPGEDIDNFDDNRTVGRRIISDLYDRYGGDRNAVLVGYNAGEQHIGQPFHQLPGETQNYIMQADAQRPVPPAQPSMPPPPGPQKLGSFRNSSEAYEAAPANQQDYMLLRDGTGGYTWTPKSSVPQQPYGPSPYYSPDTDRQINNQGVFKAVPQGVANGAVNVGRTFNGTIARTLDLPAIVADWGLRGITAGLGVPPLPFKFGHPVENLMNKLGVETEQKGSDWAASIGAAIGNGLGAVAPFIGAGGLAARGGEELLGGAAPLISKATGINPAAPTFTAANEAVMGGAAGIGQEMAHEAYHGATGREGDLGDVGFQFLGGGALNLARITLLGAAEKAAGTAIGKAWEAGKNAIGRGTQTGTAGVEGAMDPIKGKQIADAVLHEQLARNLDIADQHVAALGTVDPADSAAYLAERSGAARQAVTAFAKGSREDERTLWSPESGVNLQMPRDFTATQGLVQQMKKDHFDPNRIRNPESWPAQAEKLVGQLEAQDTLGRGQDVRSQIGQMLDDETSVQGRAADPAKIGYLQKLRNSLGDDLARGGEGVNPQEIDAYRKAMAFSAGRSQLMDSPEMMQFLSEKTGDASALDKLVKQGTAGADAVKILTGTAQARYGSEGLLGAAKDAIRQKYTNSVAPYGYVSQKQHDDFMRRYGGVLSDPAFSDVRDQLNTAAAAEQNVQPILGMTQGRGFGVGGTPREIREDRAQHYLNAPMDVTMTHLEGVSDKFSATRKVLERLDEDPTGQASLGFQHVVADKILTDKTWLAKNGGIVDALDRINPGFRQRAEELTSHTNIKGLTQGLVDWGASWAGARVGGELSKGMGSSMVMAGRSAAMARDLTKMAGEKITGLNSAMIVDQNAANAWGRNLQGLGGSPAKSVADMMLLHSYVPGLALSNLPTGQQSGTGEPGSPINPAGPPSMQGPGGQPWYKSLPSYAPGAGRT